MKDWRDPNMLVSVNTVEGTKEWAPERVRRVHHMRMLMMDDGVLDGAPPDWRDDPTYNLRKRPQNQARDRRR